MKSLPVLILTSVLIFLFSCGKKQDKNPEEKEFKIEYEQFKLDNGLNVIFHTDRSDPVVAVALTAHVGSAREIEGRTGFAHLFEHLLFLESENLGKGGLDKLSARVGGSGANGSTSRDRTNYYQTVPKDALEKMIWAEADKLGFFINTVTEPVLEKEKSVVKNEKRQSYDNQPYGYTNYVISKNLFPEGHPYNWTVIGSLEDLQNATLQDVKDFYNRWYVTNNVTLTIAGDFDTEQAKKWVEKYFSEMKRGDEIPSMEKKLVTLNETKKLYHEDNFAQLPQLTIAWPSVYQFHPDSYALEVLADYLSRGKTAPLYQVLVEDKKLTDWVAMYQYNAEISGQLMLEVNAFENVDLDSIMAGINEAFADFEKNGISQKDLDRIKAGQETSFYSGLTSVLGKGFQLAQYNIFAGSPGFINQDIKNILAVTTDDVMNVYRKYIKDKNFVATSFVPKGQTELILENSVKADVVEEKLDDVQTTEFDPTIAASYEKTPSGFDRSIEPPYGDSPDVKVPEVWEKELSSGLKLFGITNTELPLVQFQLQINGGLLLDDPGKVGVSNLLGDILTKGTKNKSPEELENAIESLGASINSYSTSESIIISGTTLAKNYPATIKLVEEIILEPRWDEKEFDLLKQSALNQILREKSNPTSIAQNEFKKLVYGENSILASNPIGTVSSINEITIDDLKTYYESNFSPTFATFHVVGDVSENEVSKSLTGLNSKWNAKEVTIPQLREVEQPSTSKIYFYDVPDAKQSVIYIGYNALTATDDDYYPATVMNYRLGGGGFASQLTQQLRETKRLYLRN